MSYQQTNNLVEAISFSIFRFLFGMLMIPQILNLIPSIHDLSKSTYVFHYPGLSFIEAYSHELIDTIAGVGIIGAVLLALGILPRLGALIFLLSFAYLFLIDMAFYNNHYYLWCLIAFLFVCSDVHKSISIVDVIKKEYKKTISISNYIVFALLISIVYFYGGVVKLNPDWLQGYPMRMLAAARNYPFPDFAGFFMSYMGIAFDLFIWILLFRKPKAIYTIIPYLAFHLSNYFIFNIGEFPLVMLAAWFVFLPLAKIPIKEYAALLKQEFLYKSHTCKTVIYTLFFLVQLLFPLRSLLTGGNVAWHRQGYYFSWRMMLNNHELIDFQFFVEMSDKNDRYAVDFSKLLSFRQFSNTYHNPYFIWLLAQKLKKDAEEKYQSANVKVYCRALITLNQHIPRPLINEKIDLGNSSYSFIAKNVFITDF